MAAIHSDFYPCTGRKWGADPLVLLHGWGNDSRVWQPLLPLLTSHLDVIAVDLPGFGQSAPCDTWQQAVVAIAEVLPVRFALLGWSLGGMLAVQLAAQYPQRVGHLITLASNAVFAQRPDWPAAAAGEVAEAFYLGFAANPAATLKQFTALEARGDGEEKVLLRWLRQHQAEVNPTTWLRALEWLDALDNRPALAVLPMPALHLFGDGDALVPVAAAHAIAGLGAAVQIMVGAGHGPHLSRPAEVADAVLAFVAPSPPADPYALDKGRIAASFGRAAASYDAFAQLQRQVGEALLALLPSPAGACPAGDGPCRDTSSSTDFSKKGEPYSEAWQPTAIADMGCGTGHFSAVLAQRYSQAECLGIDLAEGMVAFARDHHRSAANLSWLCADAEAVPLADGSFDLIYSNFAFQWSQHLNHLMAEQWRLLRSGGCLLFTTVGPDTLKELRQSWQQVDGYVHVNQFQPLAEVEAALQNAGFAIHHWQEQTLVRHHPQLNHLTRELKAIGAHNVNRGRNAGLTGRRHIEALKTAYETLRTAEGLPATWQVLFVAARKPLTGEP